MASLTIEEIAAFARSHRPTPQELRDRQVSMVVGLLPQNSTLTAQVVAGAVSQVDGTVVTVQGNAGNH